MSLNPTPTGDSHNWNYSRPADPGFSLVLVGTVKAIQEVQAMKFGNDGRPSTPDFWPDSGLPKMNIRLVLAGPSGGFRTWIITPAGKAAKAGQKKSVHVDLFALAGGVSMHDLIEKTIKIETDAPPTGFNYGVGNPRPWRVSLVTDQGPFQLSEPLDPVYLMPVVYANQAVSGGVVNPPQQAVTTPGVPDENGFMPQAAPAPAQAPSQAPAPAPVPQAPDPNEPPF